MSSMEKPKFKVLIGGKSSTLAPAGYHPHLNWTRGKLKELRDIGEKRAIEQLKINSGLNIKTTSPYPDPDPAA